VKFILNSKNFSLISLGFLATKPILNEDEADLWPRVWTSMGEYKIKIELVWGFLINFLPRKRHVFYTPLLN